MYILTIDEMSGDTPAQREAQYTQYMRRHDYYSALSAADAGRGLTFEQLREVPVVRAAIEAYDRTVVQLEAMLGPDAHCSAVDRDLWGLFSDCYKDRNGFRPHGHMTRSEVQRWLDMTARLPLEQEEDVLEDVPF